MLEEGKLTNENIVRTINSRKLIDIDQNPETQLDKQIIQLNDKNIDVSLPANRTYLQERSDNNMIKIDDYVYEENPLKIEKNYR